MNRPMISRRSRAREVALQLLYQRDLNRRADPAEAERFARERLRDPGVLPFCLALYQGVLAHRDDIDRRLMAAATNWRLKRMAAVDRNVLRLAVYELLEAHTPAPVIIDEAIEVARRFSADESVQFINGVLDAVRKALETAKTGPG